MKTVIFNGTVLIDDSENDLREVTGVDEEKLADEIIRESSDCEKIISRLTEEKRFQEVFYLATLGVNILVRKEGIKKLMRYLEGLQE